MKEQDKFKYSPLGKTFVKQIKTVKGEKQIKVLEEHGRKQILFWNEKDFVTFLRKSEIFEEFINGTMDGIQKLSDQIDFNNSIYYFKGKITSKHFIGFKVPSILYNNTKSVHINFLKNRRNSRRI